jgi:type III secretory pathway component EscT
MTPLSGPAAGVAAAVLLVACRGGPLLLALPLVRWRGRLIALILGTLLLAPLAAPTVGRTPLDGWLCARELLIGATLALSAALPWAAARSVGALLDSVGGPDQRRAGGAATLYGAVAVAAFFALGGARTAALGLAASYELLPLPPRAPVLLTGPSAQSLTTLGAQLFVLTAHLALPLLAAQLLAELLVALLARGSTGARRRSADLSLVRVLLWLGVLWLGVRALAPGLRQLIAWWPRALQTGLGGA